MSISFEEWPDDKLSRKVEAEYLSNYLVSASHSSDYSFVFNLNASWGHGKTFLLTRWMESLRKQDYSVVYFDAWANDYSKDPLLSFIFDLSDQLSGNQLKGGEKEKFKKSLSKVVNIGAKISKAGMPMIVAAAVKALTGISVSKAIEELQKEGLLDDVTEEDEDGIVESSKNISALMASEAVKSIRQSKDAVDQFRIHLEKVVNTLTEPGIGSKPLFIFVDELDRCKPTFSIQLLEHIKHLFRVDGIIFVVATDTKQLRHSVKAVYGQDFNSAGYLQRFFDVEYQLEMSSSLGFSELLTSEVSEDLIEQVYCPTWTDEMPDWVHFHHKLSSVFLLSPRDQEKVWNIVKAVLFVYDYELEKFKLQFPFLLLLAILYCKYEAIFEILEASPEKALLEKEIKELSLKRKIKLTQDFRCNAKVSRTYSNYSPTFYGILEVCSYYFTFIPISINQLEADKFDRTKPAINVIQDQVIFYRNNISFEDNDASDFMNLRSYFSRVKKAGHFSR